MLPLTVARLTYSWLIQSSASSSAPSGNTPMKSLLKPKRSPDLVKVSPHFMTTSYVNPSGSTRSSSDEAGIASKVASGERGASGEARRASADSRGSTRAAAPRLLRKSRRGGGESFISGGELTDHIGRRELPP